MTQTNKPQPILMTPLERELLVCVEDLAIRLEHSIAELTSLQQSSMSLLSKRLEALEASHMAFISSQQAFNEALIGWADQPNSRARKQALTQALKALSEIEQAALSQAS